MNAIRHSLRWAAVGALCAVGCTPAASSNSPTASSATEPITRFADASADPTEALPREVVLDRRKVALGGQLFNDKRLSGDDKVACVDCHRMDKALGDGLPRSHAVDRGETPYNSPTLFNVAQNYTFNWTGKFETLEEQLDGPMKNAKVMNADWGKVLEKLRADAGYQRDFQAIYPGAGVTEANLRDALVSYERSLLTPDARFDKYLRGDDGALTADEKAGYELFRTHGCVSCHQGANLGGNMLERFGAVRDYFDAGTARESDLGRYTISKREEDRYVFRVPSLRNVARTAPYFHDGSVASLEAAVDVMATYQLGRPLADEQTRQLVAFLGTLTGIYGGNPL